VKIVMNIGSKLPVCHFCSLRGIRIPNVSPPPTLYWPKVVAVIIINAVNVTNFLIKLKFKKFEGLKLVIQLEKSNTKINSKTSFS
jgi:hypothetical protein